MRRFIVILLVILGLAGTAGAAVDLRCYPNPVVAGRDTLHIAFRLAEETRMTVAIYTIDGRRVITIVDNRLFSPGAYDPGFDWNLKNGSGEVVIPGPYVVICETEGAGGTETEKFLLVVGL